MDIFQTVLELAQRLSPDDFVLAVISIAFTTAIYWLRIKSLRRRIRNQDAQFESIMKGQTLAGMEAQRRLAEGHLERRKQAAAVVDNALDSLTRKKHELPGQIEMNRAAFKNLQRLTSALEKELKAADGEIAELEREKQELADLIQRTQGFVSYAEREIRKTAEKPRAVGAIPAEPLTAIRRPERA